MIGRIFLAAVCLGLAGLLNAGESLYDIRDCGAKSGGESLNTEAIQKAVDI
jgi:polygalacturonase